MKTEIREVDKTRTYPRMEIYYAIEVPLTRPPRRMLGKVLSNFTAAVRGIGNRRIDLVGWRNWTGVNCGSKVGVSLDASAL